MYSVRYLTNSQLLTNIVGCEETADAFYKAAEFNFKKIDHLTYEQLIQIKGIGEKTANRILAMIEFAKRREQCTAIPDYQITCSDDAYKFLHPTIGNLQYEEFHVLFLNRNNKIMSNSQVSSGGVAGTVVDIKIILKQALERLASSIIVAHNHPSGNKRPSESDKKLTTKISEASKVMDIKLLDHLIITDDGYYSFADEGMI